MKNQFKLFKHASVNNFEQFVELFNQKRNVVWVDRIHTKDLDSFISCPDVNCKRVPFYEDLTPFIREHDFAHYYFSFNKHDDELINSAYEQIIENIEKYQLPINDLFPLKDQIEVFNPKTNEVVHLYIQIWNIGNLDFEVEIY